MVVFALWVQEDESRLSPHENKNSAGLEVDDPALDVSNYQTTQSWTACEDLATNGKDNHDFMDAGELNTEDNAFSDHELDSCASDLDTSSDLSDEANSKDFELSAEDLDLMRELGRVGDGDLASTTPRPHVDRSWWPFRTKEVCLQLIPVHDACLFYIFCQYMIASLVIGYAHAILSQSIYDRIRSMFSLVHVILPDWTTNRREKKKHRDLLQMDVKKSYSILGNPTYALSIQKILAQEVGNPLVTQAMDYYPEDARGKNIFKLSQSKKWLEDMDPDSRAPMVRTSNGDFYLFEPVQLSNDSVVVPIFFYKRDVAHEINISEFYCAFPNIAGPDGLMLSQRCQGRLYELGDHMTLIHLLPNPWRNHAKGRMIRHMPITLYCDDTSGNQSKRWNKHVPFYFTLSGLPPNWSNQQYNCHYLITSNVANVMELAGPIVDEMNQLSTTRAVAWDAGLTEEVLLTSNVLCFLGDSPMHAEATSTPIPANSLQAFRACDLSSVSVKDKATIDYVCSFTMLDSSGLWINNPKRSWAKIIENCYHIWHKSEKPWTKTAVGEEITKLGVRDVLNTSIIDRRYEILAKKDAATAEDVQFVQGLKNLDQGGKEALFSPFFQLKGFDGCADTPVEVLHVFLLGIVKYMLRSFMKSLTAGVLPEVMARYESFDTKGLNVPSLRPYYLTKHYSNLIGKDFKVALQAAPFVLFEYMLEDKRLVWSALCQLAPLVFQTHIADMDVYQISLRQLVRVFIYHLIKSTAQWVNKPKIHMLLHLADSILRFGPAALFATEKFESYNGVLRKSSIHSNRQSPGKDIGISFANFRNLRHLVSGGYFFNRIANTYQTASAKVLELFANSPSVQKSMGYNAKNLDNPIPFKPTVGGRRIRKANNVTIPSDLTTQLPGHAFKQLPGIHITRKDLLSVGSFVLFKSNQGALLELGQIDHMWEAQKERRAKFVVCLTPFEFGGISKFYNMRETRRGGQGRIVGIQDVVSTLNVQHNCHKGRCSIDLTNSQGLFRGTGGGG
ncbi:uncharacterized protein PGTG_12790 [Puccinia graminis f. sp. tritici CRL 75-36-700-3]|uniref:Uncharacterized protein n=1 Tax=Puccinia graminis f. sp. tritici (strain CRL 75-36-700-3 / race SCCL) TaxID=418459 RepID=E3KSC0_PUCGT|nr:uncharacterized protein PGTG_12790 [Puccinia graminis f. sp. tritici CRL 75-36-700-3]EFP87206.2 hypothetical protein PGTG_12790 [Puccinia graminis f. sp. tritici CRL 75-36-700-3]